MTSLVERPPESAVMRDERRGGRPVSGVSFAVRVTHTARTVRVTHTLNSQRGRRRRRRARTPIETPQFAAMMRRMLRSWARRVGASDPEDLSEMVAYRALLDEAIQDAIDIGRATSPDGWSWTRIGRAVGTTKASAYERYGPLRRGARS